MPIEREFKYVLQNTPEVEATVAKAASSSLFIRQGYLNKGGRVRSSQKITKKGKLGKAQFMFNYKHDLQHINGTLEIETPISPHDFELAWGDTNQRVAKNRHHIEHGGYVWEIDCLKTTAGDTYLIMAECEVDPLAGRPDTLLPLVERHLIHAVEENDARFTNRKLSDPQYAKILVNEVTDNIIRLQALGIS